MKNERKNIEDTEYVAYTDGGCQNLSVYGEGGSSYIILKEGKVIKTASKGFLNTSNNRMEMLSIISAINSVPKGSSITIYSDSQYAIYVFTGKWKPKLNRDLVIRYHQYAKDITVKFVWIKGHNGNPYNEMVDELCTQAINNIVEAKNLPKNRFTKRKANNQLSLSL